MATKATPDKLLDVFSGKNVDRIRHKCGGDVYASLLTNTLKCSHCQEKWSKVSIIASQFADSKNATSYLDLDIWVQK